jgi:phosphatidylserine/phosphatidylglycerophosphate/cardiolipin synthase-like enzyme
MPRKVHPMIDPESQAEQLTVRFSPRGECESLICQVIDAATLSIHAMIYDLTSTRISYAIAEAANRGVPVVVIADYLRACQPHSLVSWLASSPADVRVDKRERIYHHKVLIADVRHVLCGSFNWTNAAEHENAEDLLYLPNRPYLAGRYVGEMSIHLYHAKPVIPGQQPAAIEFSRATPAENTPEFVKRIGDDNAEIPPALGSVR